MSRTSTIVIALGVLALAGSASAQTFEGRFKYDRHVSAEENYATFEGIAQKACAVSPMEAGGLYNKLRREEACTDRMLEQAVKGADNAALSSVHALRTGSTTLVARRD
jgi:hypothetical protein